MRGYEQAGASMREYAPVCAGMPRYAREYARVCVGMGEYARLCVSYMRRYVRVYVSVHCGGKMRQLVGGYIIYINGIICDVWENEYYILSSAYYALYIRFYTVCDSY